jgi:hypothetical protein
MDFFGRLVGGFILVFLAIPALIGVIWTTGVTSAVVGEEFVGDVITDVADQIPSLVDEVFEVAKDPEAVKDPDFRLWVDAASKVEKSPSQLLTEIGFYDWLKEDLGGSLDTVGKMLQGDKQPEDVVLSFKRLKDAFRHPALREYIADVIGQLPDCTPEDFAEWDRVIQSKEENKDLPACNPGAGIVGMAVSTVVHELDDIPDQELIIGKSEVPAGFNFARAVSNVLWLLFLIPGALILFGALIAGRGRAGFLLWSGATTLTGGLTTLMISSLMGDVVLAALQMDPAHWNWEQHGKFWTTEPGRLVASRMADMVSLVIEHVFDPVTTIAAVVSALGVILLVLGFVAPGHKD